MEKTQQNAAAGPLPRAVQILDPKWDGRSSFTVKEAAEICRLSRPGAYEAAAKGRLPTVRIGRRLIVPRHALERLLLGEGQAA